MRPFSALFLIGLVLSATLFFPVEGRVEAEEWESLKAQLEELMENRKALADTITTAVFSGVQGIVSTASSGASPLDIVKSIFNAVTGIVSAATGATSPATTILNSVFNGILGIIDTALKAAPAPATPPPGPAPAGSVGCYKDGLFRALNGPHFSNFKMSSALCRPFCRGYKYFGLQWGIQCFCGNDYTKFGAAAATDCNKPCPGNGAETCGGWFRNSVYTV